MGTDKEKVYAEIAEYRADIAIRWDKLLKDQLRYHIPNVVNLELAK